MSQPSDPRRENQMARAGGDADLDRAVREDFDRIRTDALLARQDASAELARAIEDAVRAPLALEELSGVLDRLENPVFAELEGLLSVPESAGLNLESRLISELLRGDNEIPGMLKRGLVFLKHRRYAEALEWWSLNRGAADSGNGRVELLMLVMESLTHHWAGDAVRARATRDKVAAHKLYRALTGGLERS